MPRFAGIPVEETQKKPRFAGLPVDAPAPAPNRVVGGADPALSVPGAPPAPAQPQQKGPLEYAGETLDYTVDRARQGVSNLAGLPIDLINASPLVMRLFGFDTQPFNLPGGSAGLNQATKQIMMAPGYLDDFQPDAFQTVAGRVGEELGASALPVGGMFAAANSMGLPAVRAMTNPVGKALLEPFAVDGAKTVGKELAAATAAGTGAGLANLLVDRDTTMGQAADLGGALGGVGLYAAGSGFVRGLGDLVAAMSGNTRYASNLVQEQAANTIMANSDVIGRRLDAANLDAPVDNTDLVELLRQQSPAEQVIPGFQATTADRAGDFGIANLTNNRSGGNAGLYRGLQQSNTKAVDAALDPVRPTEQPGALTSALETERMNALNSYESEFIDAMAALERATGPLQVPPDSTLATRGNAVRTDLLTARDAARANTDAAYQAAEVGGTPVDAASLADTIDQATAGMTVAERSVLPNDLLDQVRALGRGGKTTPSQASPVAFIPPTEADIELAVSNLVDGPIRAERRAIVKLLEESAAAGEKLPKSLDTLLNRYVNEEQPGPRSKLFDQLIDGIEMLQANGVSLPPKVVEALDRIDMNGPATAALKKAPHNQSYAREAYKNLWDYLSSLDEAGLREFDRLNPPSDTPVSVEDVLAPIIRGRLELAKGVAANSNDATPPSLIDIREATTLLTRLRRAQRLALGPTAENGGRDASRVIEQVADSLETFIGDNITPDQQGLLDAARQAKFAEAEAFGRKGDPVAEALRQFEGGRFMMSDERVAPQFASSDEKLGRLFAQADTPNTRTAIRQELLSRLDTSSPERINDFMAVYRDQIGRFPGLEGELRTAAQASGEVAASGIERDAMRKFFGTPDGSIKGTSSIAKYLAYEPVQARKAMENVLNSKSPTASMDEILSFVGDDVAAVEGARAAFWQVMESKSKSSNAAFAADGVDPWMPKKWKTFLDQPNVAAVAERLYQDNPEHLDSIRQIAEALQGVNMANKAGAALNPSGTAKMLQNGPVTMAEAQAKFIDVQRGRLNPLYAVTYLAGKIANRLVSKKATQAYNLLLDKALLDPEIAAKLLAENNPANRAALARSAKGWLGNQASSLIEILNDEEEPE